MDEKDVTNMDVWRESIQQDINSLKSDHKQLANEQASMKNDISSLQINDKLQDQEIRTIKDTIKEIKDDTGWIRRKITGAIITATITAVVAGVIGIAIANIF
ncbi:hemolysin XhlA family protein [Oceanobacillus indicireducens]|uniref:Protein xhlA n=1 Tax=Oceanobacillus indicireducens TaxID=1004261 RepID=A0A917Y5M9_9BACI|nr:hemolysin XhlA family protein [Oceanobacillus indicireducens]GGN67629.1 hypothetical protein GCM10007971_38630 [Oceanobacillus indicireducens]